MVLGFFGLWETTLAVAGAAASVPIIIHLLNRRRFRIVIWAAMRFLLNAQKQNTRRMRLEQLILLALRVLLVLLVVGAMASVTPWAEAMWNHFWPDGAGFARLGNGRTHRIIVLDGSLSMAVKTEGGKTAFERASELAVQLVSDSAAGDGFHVLLMKETPTWIIAETAQDAGKVAREIGVLRQPHGNAPVPQTLNMVAAKLAESSSRFDTREVYFFTDLQKATWAGNESPGTKDGKEPREKQALDEIQRRARTIFLDVGRDGVNNLAVTDLSLGDTFLTSGALVPVSAMVQNFGLEPRQHVRVDLLAGRARSEGKDPPFALRVVDTQVIHLKAGERVAVSFAHKFTTAGTYALQVRVEPDDLELDDARTAIVTVKDTIPVLLVNGKAAVADRFDKATGYLRLALNPYPKGQAPRTAPLRPRVVSPTQFADPADTNLIGYDCVFLCDVGRVGTNEIGRLEAHLRGGGGLVVALGERSAEHLEVYNRLFYKKDEGLLPAKLLGLQQAPAEHYFVLQAPDEGFLQAPLKAFNDDDDRASLRSVRFRQYVRAKPAADAKVRSVLSFMPEIQAGSKVASDQSLPLNDPAILEWNPPLPPHKDNEVQDQGDAGAGEHQPPQARAATRYRGKVVLVTSTLNMDWNSWPGSPSFGAMMQELTRYAVSGRLRDRHTVVGGMLEEFLPGSVELDAAVVLPGQEHAAPRKVRTQGVEDVQVFRWTDTDQSGIYRMTVGQDPHEYLFAVNVPATTPGQRGSESDLARLDKDKLQEAYPGLDFQLVRALGDVRHTGGPLPGEAEVVRNPIGPAIAHYLLLAVLALLLVEVVLAWVFGHYSAVAGAIGEPAPTGAFWPAVVAAVAGVAFIATAGVLIHAGRTGDLLGFLPESFRGWVEGLLGVPPPAPGEGTRWSLEFAPYMRDAASDPWLAGGIALVAGALVFGVYRLESRAVVPAYKVLLGGLRIFLILFVLAVLLPQLQLRFERQGWPDVVVLLDDSRSMGEPDSYQDESVQEKANGLADKIRKQLQESLPEKIRLLEARLDERQKALAKTRDPRGRTAADRLAQKVQALQTQLAQVNSPSWRPSRLQLAQALLSRDNPDWLQQLLHRRKMKVHVYHLDLAGRAVKLLDSQGNPADVTDVGQPQQHDHALRAVNNLDAEGNDSRLGSAVRQVLDHYRGASLAAVVMMTDGVTTKDETIGQVADYAAQKGVPLFFVGIGDDHEIRDLRLHDLQVEDTVYVNDHVVFEARLTGSGYKGLTVPVVLKVKDRGGTERELKRVLVQVDPQGKSVKVRLKYQPTEPGEKLFIVQIEVPKSDKEDKAASAANTRLQRTVFVQEAKLMKVLFVEGSARYEYRFIKNLLERESPEKRNKTVDLKVVLIDSDEDFPKQDKSALSDFPFNKQELYQYDVVILGDVDPHAAKMGDAKLRDLADFVRERGGGLLMIAGANFSPHAYKDTPLADVLPIEPNAASLAEPEERVDGYRLELTPAGRLHPIFRFSPDDAENLDFWNKLAPMYWWSEGYRTKPVAEVLAVHPKQKNEARGARQVDRHPLAVQHFVGAGRCLFFGFDETWRWRLRDDEVLFNQFWNQTVRYLSRSRLSHAKLFLDRQTPYRVGEPIKVSVQFPDNAPIPAGLPGIKPSLRSEVKVIAEYRPLTRPSETGDTEVQTLQLAKVEGSWATYEALLTRTREGKYRFWLSSPDVSKQQPNGQKPSAEATVVQPPGELDRLRMNQQELTQAAEATRGRFYTLATADRVLDDLPAGTRVTLNTPRPPQLLWNHWLCFLLVMGLLTSEWLLRKRKHLL
jgi:hypothetical protein